MPTDIIVFEKRDITALGPRALSASAQAGARPFGLDTSS
jgi:hypothetical protein